MEKGNHTGRLYQVGLEDFRGTGTPRPASRKAPLHPEKVVSASPLLCIIRESRTSPMPREEPAFHGESIVWPGAAPDPAALPGGEPGRDVGVAVAGPLRHPTRRGRLRSPGGAARADGARGLPADARRPARRR